MEIYVVQPGDTVDSIALTFQLPPDSIIYVNQLIPPYALAVGQSLLLDTSPESGPEALPSLVSFGYAYPYISPWVLNQTLPFLTDLCIFSYGFTAEGNLLPPPQDNTWMLDAARTFDVRTLLTLTPFGSDGQFNNALIHSVVQNTAYKENLISQLLETVQQKGFDGIDVDFEYILAKDRDAFTNFVADLADMLRPRGYTISVALAPKSSAAQTGILVDGKDYSALGAIADSVLLMTYEWGYKYGPNLT